MYTDLENNRHKLSPAVTILPRTSFLLSSYFHASFITVRTRLWSTKMSAFNDQALMSTSRATNALTEAMMNPLWPILSGFD